jgi:hypothetical protein
VASVASELPVVIYDPLFDQSIRRMVHGSKKSPTKGWAFYRLTHKGDDWCKIRLHKSRPILAIMKLSDIEDDLASRFRSLTHRPKNFLLFSDDVPPEALPDRVMKLGLHDLRHIHLSHKKLLIEQIRLVERWLSVLAGKNADHRIAEAWWDGDVLVVISPRFERLQISSSKIASLRGKERRDLDRFEVDEDGSYVYWPSLDVHLGWDQLAEAANPEAALKARQREHGFNQRYGATIRILREAQGLRQSDVPGLSSKQVGRIEKGDCRATHRALAQLAKAHGMTTLDYLNKLAVSVGQSETSSSASQRV